MTTSEFSRATGHDKATEPRTEHHLRPEPSHLGPTTLLLIDPDNRNQLVPLRNRVWIRFVARVCASTLDRELAQGRPPESSRLLAARAQVLVSLAMRVELASNLAHVLREARRPPIMRDRRAPLNRDSIRGCETEIRQACDALLTPFSTPARGAAIISWMLRDGTGPLYNRHRSADLHIALAEASARLNPFSPLSTLRG
jgi:hypothetical protein